MDELARRLRAPIDRLPTRRAHACVAFREPSEEARTVDHEYEPISVVGSSVYELDRQGMPAGPGLRRRGDATRKSW